MTLILASASPVRHALLRDAGIAHEIVRSDVDERAIEAALVDVHPEDLPQILADTKAATVSAQHPASLVIGADQVLLFDGLTLAKCTSMEEARARLLQLSGKTHELVSAVCLARGGEIVWRHQTTTRLTMHDLSPAQIGRYCAEAGDDILGSVGCYHLEGIGVRLMKSVEGDYFSILGLPLLPLLEALTHSGMATVHWATTDQETAR